MPPEILDPYFTPAPSPSRRGIDSSERVRQIASRANISPDIAEDYLKTTKIESGHNVNVRDSSKGAQGFGQVLPDVKGGTTRTVGGHKYNLRNPDENIEAGLKYFAEGGPDPTSRRLYYFGGPKARKHYEETGQIPNISDGNMTATQYVRATGGGMPNAPVRQSQREKLTQQPTQSDPYFTPDTPLPQGRAVAIARVATTPQPQTKRADKGWGTGTIGQGVTGGVIPQGARAEGEVSYTDADKVRNAVRAAAPPGFGLLPRAAQEAVGEQLAKGASGLTRMAAGVVRGVPHDPFAGKNQITDQSANKLNTASQVMASGGTQMEKQANRPTVHVPVLGDVGMQDVYNIGGGAISSAPAMVLTSLGIPAPVAFGLQSYLESTGRDADWKDVLKETGMGAATGALFEIPLPARMALLAKIGAKLGIVGGGTYGIEKLAGMPEAEARKNAAVNALFGASGVKSERPEIKVPIQTVPESMQGRVRLGDIAEQAKQVGATVLNPEEVVAGGKPKIRTALREGVNETQPQPNVATQPESTQPTRGEGKGQFKEETAAQAEARRAQVNPEQSAPQTPVEAAPKTEALAVRQTSDVANVPEMVSLRPINKTQAQVEFTRREGQVSDDELRSLFPDYDLSIRRVRPFSGGKSVQGVELTFWEKSGTKQVPVPEDLAQRFGLKSAFGRQEEPQLASVAKPQPQPIETKPSEPELKPDPYFTPESSTTSAKHESMRADRAVLGLPEVAPKEVRKDVDLFASAKAANKADPLAVNRLADRVLSDNHQLSDKETNQLILRAQEIKNQHRQVLEDIARETDSETIKTKGSEADALLREYERLSQASDTSGTEQARAFRARRHEIDDRYERLPMLAEAKKAKGRDLTSDERMRYEKMAGQIEDLNKQLVEANEKAKTAQLQRQIGKIQRQSRRQQTKSVLNDEFASLKASLAQAKLETRSGVQGSLLAGLDPEGKLTPIIAKMAKNRVKAGVNSAEALVDEVFSAVKDHYDVSRDDIAKIVRGTLHQPDDVLSKWDKRRQSQLLKQQSDVETRLAGKDFSPKASRETPIYNRETFRLQKQVNELKAQYDREMYRATRGTTGKIIDTAAGFGNIPKTMLSMADVSAVLRQGGIGVYQHPILSGRAGMDMLKAFTSHGFANVENAIKNSPRFDQAKRSGVEFTGIDKDNPQLSKHEEGYLGSGGIDTLAKGRVNPLRLVKGVKDFSERTFVSFLDSQRMRIFENQAKALEDMGLKGRELDGALKSQARYINIITGRGSLGVKGNQAAPALNVALFSPRLIASRVQFLNKMINPVSWANTPKGARKLQMIDNAKFLFGLASTLALAKAAGADVSLDPDDSEFLKIKVGNTRYDTLAGLQQPMRFMYRMTRAMKGSETYEGADKGKILGDFARSKAAPLAGYAADYFEGKNRLSGKRFEAGKDLVRNVVPLPFQDFQEAIKEDGAVRGIAAAFPSLFGVGTQIYPTSPEKANTKAEKLARKFIGASLPDEGRTSEEIDLDQKKGALRAQSRRGNDVTEGLKALQGLVTDRQAKSILGSRGQTRLQEDVKRLPLYDPQNHRDVLTVYSTMSPSEQESVKKIVGEKAATVDLLPMEQQKDVRDRLVKLGFKPGLNIPRPPPRPQRPDKPNQRAWSYQQ